MLYMEFFGLYSYWIKWFRRWWKATGFERIKRIKSGAKVLQRELEKA